MHTCIYMHNLHTIHTHKFTHTHACTQMPIYNVDTHTRIYILTYLYTYIYYTHTRTTFESQMELQKYFEVYTLACTKKMRHSDISTEGEETLVFSSGGKQD